MFQISIFFQMLSYFRLLMSFVLPFVPGKDSPSDEIDPGFTRH